MPTYHYVCAKCDHEFEFFQSMKNSPLKVCPKELCPQTRWGRGKVQRQLGTGAGLLFKGSGFYTTDYRSEGYREAAKKETESATPKKDGGAAGGEKKGAGAAPSSAPTPAPKPAQPKAADTR
ncbi:MAG: zinc ribbon domain-containing protein [Verrucomicrobia bacterium]|nr:zinc ribbon domain-containing protein [Verrucomicrobiota bacterium]